MASESESATENSTQEKNGRRSYWSDLVSHYEKRNASLERRHDALAEKVRLMELTLPSVLLGAVVDLKSFPIDKQNDSSSTESAKHDCPYCTYAESLCNEEDKRRNHKCEIKDSTSKKKEQKVTH